ncbi:MAG: FeS-binding protein [Desulfobacterales bacterium]|nr:FeS-binding protein [Desulfobacterales bacterium]
MPQSQTAARAAVMMAPSVKAFYLTLLVFMGLSGFGQMPIFKRYYVADLPGLGWLAQFYVTHYIHYLGAILLLGIAAYYAVLYLADRRRELKITLYGWLQAGVMAGIVVTGVLRVIKNYPGVTMSSGLIVFLDILHLVLVMALMMIGLVGLCWRRRWLKIRNQPELGGRS